MGFTSTAVARTPVLEITYEQAGPAGGVPVILMHGFPYDVRSYDEVVAPLVARGAAGHLVRRSRSRRSPNASSLISIR